MTESPLHRPAAFDDGIHDQYVEVPIDGITLEGRLTVPSGAKGIVIFAHGSGSSRFSPRNWQVAEVLHAHGIASLLIDLLTASEGRIDDMTRRLRFDIPMLAARLAAVARWVHRFPATRQLELCFFGSSTGAGAALIAAAEMTDPVAAIVSRGGRPDLAGDYLRHVKAPTLLIVGSRDTEVLALNEEALANLNASSKIHVVTGATHLFEEEGKLEEVAHLAAEWFRRHVGHRSGHAG
ncbi:dienelactone hydrolase family protein [Pseudokordiimonas caeni]|uniref:dienelactone hydrolase family protein n=1 Tax=Pseudokordiimonas caeni TaxID=2997908 RepID=UPI002810C518|nr:alpha/beta family hydrolase [Pseudokordiimonas caeni]